MTKKSKSPKYDDRQWLVFARKVINDLRKKNRQMHKANTVLGKWMSAALDDPSVCVEMKADIEEWFTSWT